MASEKAARCSHDDNHSEYPHIPLRKLDQVKGYKNLRGRLYYRISVEERVYGFWMQIIRVHTLGINIIVVYAQHDKDEDNL